MCEQGRSRGGGRRKGRESQADSTLNAEPSVRLHLTPFYHDLSGNQESDV